MFVAEFSLMLKLVNNPYVQSNYKTIYAILSNQKYYLLRI